MDHSLPQNSEILQAELARLYERRLLLDELIRNLERYAEFPASRPNALFPNAVIEGIPLQLPGV